MSQDYEARQPEGRGGLFDDVSTATGLIRAIGPYVEKIVKFVAGRIEKWDNEGGGPAIVVFGKEVFRIRL